VLALYAMLGLGTHLWLFGAITWETSTYVVMALWPFPILWEVLVFFFYFAMIMLVCFIVLVLFIAFFENREYHQKN